MKLQKGLVVMFGFFLGNSGWDCGFADPPGPTRTSPHDWECTYAFSDTTCREMISAWAQDEGLTSTSVAEFKQCSDCQRNEVVGAYSTRYLIGYDCNNRDGHDRRFSSLDAVVGVYREAENEDEGWRVTGWRFHRCLLTWRCARSCAIDFDRAVCVPLSGYYIGRWVPEMGTQCQANAAEGEVGELNPPPQTVPNRETHWHGIDDLPKNYR